MQTEILGACDFPHFFRACALEMRQNKDRCVRAKKLQNIENQLRKWRRPDVYFDERE